MASAGPYASLCLAPDRQPRQHPITQFIQAWCPSCCPTNSVKALKASQYMHGKVSHFFHYLLVMLSCYIDVIVWTMSSYAGLCDKGVKTCPIVNYTHWQGINCNSDVPSYSPLYYLINNTNIQKRAYNRSYQGVKVLAASEAMKSYRQGSLYKDCPQARGSVVYSNPWDEPVRKCQIHNCCADKVLPVSDNVQSRPVWLFDLNCNETYVNINEFSFPDISNEEP